MQIMKNMIETPDGTFLVSMSQNNCDSYIDENGKKYIVSGGLFELERYGAEDYIERSLYNDSDIELLREHITWGSYGKTGREPLKKIKIKDLEIEHIDNIILTQHQIGDVMTDIFIRELGYRVTNC